MHVDNRTVEAPASAEVRQLARVLWDYHHITTDPLPVSDIILVLGSHDLRLARHAAELFLDGRATLVVISGAQGKATEGWRETEAETFARVTREAGVPEHALLLEQTATNTGANITASRTLLGSAASRSTPASWWPSRTWRAADGLQPGSNGPKSAGR